MWKALIRWTVLLVGCCGVVVDASAQDALPAQAADLLKMGDDFAAEKKYEEALISYKKAYEKLVPVIRKLEFKQPVQPRLMTRPQLRDYMAQEFKTEYTPEELKLLDRSLKAFGLVPQDLDVQELLVNMLTEEVGGFYNPRTKEMYLIQEEVKRGSFLTRLFSGPEFDPEEQRITLSHEMTHALADQHFDLVAMDKAAANNDDMMMAISGLVEGEATVVMLSEMLDEPGLDVTKMEPERMDFTFQVMSMAAPIFGGRTMRSAPPIFQQSLIFPYHQGSVFVLHLTNRDGWDAIDRAYREPPVSTEQILHWEKYAVQRDNPTTIELPKIQEAIDPKWKSLGQNTLGELQTKILFETSADRVVASEGWDGDRYEIFEHEDGRLALAWYTTWDSENDAREFCATAAQWFAQVAYQNATNDHSRSSLKSTAQEARQLWETQKAAGVFEKQFGDHGVYLETRGQDAIVLVGFTTEIAKSVTPQLWQSQKAELTLRR